MTVCQNCGNEFQGNYCNNCGQTADTHRFSLKHIFHEAVHTFTHADKGLLKLIPDLFTKPGETVRNYIAGQRKRYFNPIQFLIIMTAIAAFATIQFHVMESVISTTTVNLHGRALFFSQFNTFIYKYINIIMFLSVPLFALFTRIFFWKSGYNYAENLIMNTFYAGQRSVMYVVIIIPLVIIWRPYLTFIMMGFTLLWMIYYYYAFAQFFKFRSVWMFLKGFLCIALFYVIHGALMFGTFYLFFYKP